METKNGKRIIRKKRIKAKLSDNILPRLSVFRSNKHIYAQIIDDGKGVTLISASDKDIDKKGKKTEIASEVGKIVAEKAAAKKIKNIVFDRSGYKYHGQVKALAESARKHDLVF
jgi:large subunit ribosomal protein L18